MTNGAIAITIGSKQSPRLGYLLSASSARLYRWRELNARAMAAAGAGTSPASVAMVGDVAQSNIPMPGYTVPYAVSSSLLSSEAW